MEVRGGRDKQSESESDRNRRNPHLRFNDRISRRKITLYRLLKATLKQSSTTLHDLPLEMLDVILQKSYLHWVLNSSTKQRDEEVIIFLISVDVCFNKRITRQRFKKTIWRYLKNFYGKAMNRHSIIRNNRNYLENNIQLNDELLASLLSLNCITDEQSHFVQRHRLTRDKNYELLYIMESFDETKFSTFVNCLRRKNQRTVAKVLENGGGVIKIEVQTRVEMCRHTASMETHQFLHKKINDLRNRTKPRSHETDKLIAQLRDEGLEILNSQLDGQTVVVWIWCHSQAAIENLQRLYESNQLRDKYFENVQPSVSKVTNIDSNQFSTTFAVRPISIKLIQKIELSAYERALMVTKLRNEIYVLRHIAYGPPNNLIAVFEDRNPFRKKLIEIDEITFPFDIGSSEKENCLYVSDENNCVWKITRETDDKHKIIKWLKTNYEPWTLSVSRDGELLMINRSSRRLMIYGSDAKLIRSIPLTRDIKEPLHAVETSIGNFVVIDRQETDEGDNEVDEEDEDEEEEVVMEEQQHKMWQGSRDGEDGSSSWKDMMSAVRELTRDGQMVIRRFIPSYEIKDTIDFRYLSIDSVDRMFVADSYNDRVILLDSDLKLNRIICPTRKLKVGQFIRKPTRLTYDEETKQLIVIERRPVGNTVNIYTLSRS